MREKTFAGCSLAGIPGSPAAFHYFLMNATLTPATGKQTVLSCRVQSEGVKNESKGLQETGLPARCSTVIQWRKHFFYR